MAVFFKTPAPPGVSAVGVRAAVVVHAEHMFGRRAHRPRASLACHWIKDADGRLVSCWADHGSSSHPSAQPVRLAAGRR